MKMDQLKTFKIPLKFALLICLFYNLYFTVEAKGNPTDFKLYHSEGLDLNVRMSKIEAENQQHKTDISLLKAVVEEDKKSIALLTIKIDDGLNSISKLESENVKKETENNALKTKIEELSGRFAKWEATATLNGSETNGRVRKDDVTKLLKRPARLLPLQAL